MKYLSNQTKSNQTKPNQTKPNLYFICALFFAFISCQNELNESLVGDSLSNNLHFDKKNNILTLSEYSDVKVLYDNLKNDENKDFSILDKYYEQGFLPLRPAENSSLRLQKKIYQEKINKYQSKTHTEVDGSDIITNDYFASLLNDKGEIAVGDSIYKYTTKGVYIAHKNNRSILDNYPTEGKYSHYQKNGSVDYYEPNVGDMGNFTIDNVDECGDPISDPNHLTLPNEYFDCGTGGGNGYVDLESPDNSNYIHCEDNNKDGWVDNIFGKTYYCEYFFDSNHKIRTVYGAEDFYFFTDVYSQAKFKEKGFLGFWFSDRKASTVYLLNRKAILSTERVKRGFDFSINIKDVEEIYNDIYSFFLSNPEHKSINVTNVYNTETNQVTNFIINPNTLINNSSQQFIANTPTQSISKPIINFNFKDFFGRKVDKAITVNIIGLNKSFSNTDIIKLSHQVLSGHNSDQYNTSGTGAIVFTYQDPRELGKKAEPICYALYGEKTQVYNLAVARREYNIPEDFSVTEAAIFYRQTHNNATGTTNNYIGLKFNFNISVVKSANLELESGAYFNGRWGGSQFKVKY